MFLTSIWFSLHYLQHIICNIIYGILFDIKNYSLFETIKAFSLELLLDINNHQNVPLKIWPILRLAIVSSQMNPLVFGVCPGLQRTGWSSFMPSSFRTPEDVDVLWWPGLNYILRLRYTFLKMRNRIVRSRCYNKRPVGSFRWSRYQSNSFGWKIRNQNQKWSRIWRPSHRNLFTFQLPSHYNLNFTVSSKYILKIFLKWLAWKQIRASHRCWWRMLETKCVGDKFEMLVTGLHWENHQHNEKRRQHNEKSRQHNDSATNILNQSPL